MARGDAFLYGSSIAFGFSTLVPFSVILKKSQEHLAHPEAHVPFPAGWFAVLFALMIVYAVANIHNVGVESRKRQVAENK